MTQQIADSQPARRDRERAEQLVAAFRKHGIDAKLGMGGTAPGVAPRAHRMARSDEPCLTEVLVRTGGSPALLRAFTSEADESAFRWQVSGRGHGHVLDGTVAPSVAAECISMCFAERCNDIAAMRGTRIDEIG